MIVYGELLFIENMIIGGVLLYLTDEICGRNIRSVKRNVFGPSQGRSWGLFRLAVGSVMCGAFSLVIFLNVKAPIMLLMEFVFAVAVCTVVFGCKRRGCERKRMLLRLQLQKAVVFILVTYFMGGIVMGTLLVTQQQGIYTAAGVYTGDMKAAALALFICLGYVTIRQMIRTVKNKKLFTEHTYEAEIIIGEHIFKVSAFLDTGNRLKDPLTGKPVAVASKKLWERMMQTFDQEEILTTEADASTAFDMRFMLVPYESVGAKGLIRAFRTDYIEIRRALINTVDKDIGENIDVIGKQVKGCLVAGGGTAFGFEKKGKYDLLISAEMVDG